MKVIIEDEKDKKIHLNHIIEWLVGMVGYAIILIAVSILFPKTLHIDSNLFGMWALVAAIITFILIAGILNKTIKPILFWLTLPITGLTLGLFYPFINVFILYIVSFLLQDHFQIHGIWMAFLIAVIISILNMLMDSIVLTPLFRRNRS